MLKNVIKNNRKAIMIYPFVSLAREKLNHLQVISYNSIYYSYFILNLNLIFKENITR
jgi:hypothetical protein